MILKVFRVGLMQGYFAHRKEIQRRPLDWQDNKAKTRPGILNSAFREN